MFRLAVISFALALSVTAQVGPRSPKYSDSPQFASILNEQRYLSGDGTFGAAYQQEDGIDFKEESDAEGNRKGSYSYIDPTGQRRTVTYTAGKNGFVASGDHLPVAPAPPPQPAQNSPQYNTAPSPQYNRPSPQYNSISSRQYDPDNDDGQYRPELYEGFVAPSQNQIATSAPIRPAYSASYSAKPQPQYSGAPQPQYSAAPQPQYSGQVNNQFNPGFPQSRTPFQEPSPKQNYYQFDQTTPVPHRFFPPGQFDLNRSPDGYTYSFRKA